MKTLLDVTKTLLLINGVVVLPSLLLFKSMYQQQLIPIAKIAQGNDSSSRFHRHLDDDSLKYQQKLKETEKELQQVKTEASSQISALQTALRNAQSQNPVNVTIASSSSPNLLTPEATTVSQPLTHTQKPSPVLARKGTTLSDPVPNTQNPKPLAENITQKAEPVESTQETVVTQQIEVKESSPPIVPQQTEAQESSPLEEPSQSQNEETTIYPEGYISINDLAKNDRNTLDSNTTFKGNDNDSIHVASLLHEGLIVAGHEGQINRGTTVYKQVRKAIEKLNQGQSRTIEEAANSSGLEKSILVQVERWGRKYARSRELAHDIQIGLMEAGKRKKLNRNTSKYDKVHTAIRILRNGKSQDLEEVADLSGVEAEVLRQLAIWGKNRPGSSSVSHAPN